MAPEVFKSFIPNTKAADLWSFGCFLFEMAFKKRTFGTGNDSKKQFLICQGKYNFPKNNTASEEIKDLITKLIKIVPKERLGYKNLN